MSLILTHHDFDGKARKKKSYARADIVYVHFSLHLRNSRLKMKDRNETGREYDFSLKYHVCVRVSVIFFFITVSSSSSLLLILASYSTSR